MERKTIGSFIAALRKANGMTQKELAERLNVSDKSVSRWERDDGSPDLALIPVIAEVFGVTCDELLRGERRPAGEREETARSETPTPKGEKQKQRLLAYSLTGYKTQTFITMGISAAGLIAAMAGNFGFLRGYLGFLIGAVFYLAALVCQGVFVNFAFLAVSDESLVGEDVGRFKWSVVKLAELSMGLTAVLLGCSLPLVVFTGDAYRGLSGESWLLYGMIFGAAALLIVAVVCYRLNASLLKKGVCALRGREEQAYWHNHTLKGKCALGLAAAVAATLVLHGVGSETLWSAENLAEGVTFHDYDSFVEYMEQDIPYQPTYRSYPSGWFTTAREHPVAPDYSVEEVAPEVDRYDSSGEEALDRKYYDEHGNEISEEQALTRELLDKNGNVVCTYLHRNEMASVIRYNPQEGTVLPITVIDEGDFQAARAWSEMITLSLFLLYPVELFVAILVYLRKRAR